ncbi:hypothetical protein [Streptomyces sp. NPDC058394]
MRQLINDVTRYDRVMASLRDLAMHRQDGHTNNNVAAPIVTFSLPWC